MRISTMTAAIVVPLTAGNALGGFIATQTAAPAPIYGDHQVTFDEVGVPTGVAIDPFDFYLTSDSVSFFSANGETVVDDWDTLAGIAGGNGMGNQLKGGFSVNMAFSGDITELSFQAWADGNPNPPFGGLQVRLYDDDVQVFSWTGISPLGGVGDEYFDIVADGGDAFDRISIFGSGFGAFTTYVDNVSWNVQVPGPGALALLGVAGLCSRRRRRREP